MAKTVQIGPYKITPKPKIKAKGKGHKKSWEPKPLAKRDEAKRILTDGRPAQPGVEQYAKQQAKKGKPLTNKTGKKITQRERQQVRARELTDLYLQRRKIADAPKPAPKPLPKTVAGPNLPKEKPHKPTVSNRSALHQTKAIARQIDRDKAHARKTTLLGTVPVVGAVTNQARKELEGTGALSDVFGGLSKSMRTQIASITGKDGRAIPGTKGVARVAGNAVADLFEMPAQAAPSVYMPAKAVAKDIASGKHGKGSESRKFVDDYLKTSATALAIQGKGDEAKKAAAEHPLFTAMELRGIKAVVGRGAGAGMRAIPGPTRKAASTKRAPLKVHGNITVPRRYSKDVLTKGATVAVEKAKRKRGIDPDQASPKRVVSEINRRIDEEVDAIYSTGRAKRDKILKEWDGKGDAQRAAALVPNSGAWVPKTFWNDLAAYRNHLKRLDKTDMPKAERAANRQLVQQVEKALKKQIDPKIVFDEVARFKKQQAPIMGQMVKKTNLEPAQVRMAPLVPYAVTRMGAKWNKKNGPEHYMEPRLEIDGKPVTPGQIERHMKANGAVRPGFIEAKPNFRGPQNFYMNAHRPQHNVVRKSRTGEATYKGTHDADPAVLGEQLSRQQAIISTVDGWENNIVKTFGTGKSKGKLFDDWDEATRAAEELRRDPDGNLLADNIKLVPVRVGPFAANKKVLDGIRQRLAEDTPSLDALHDLEGAAEQVGRIVDAATRRGPGKVVLLPEMVVKRLRQHDNVGTEPLSKVVGLASSGLKKTVLPVSTKWLTGQVVDPSMRLALEGAGPGAAITHLRVFKRMKEIDPKAAESYEARNLGGMLYSSARKNTKYRDAAQFRDSKWETPMAIAGTVRRTPGIKHVIDGYNAYSNAVLKLNSMWERGVNHAAAGKELRRQVQDTTGAWHKSILLGEKAIDDLARGLLDTNNQVAMGRSIERVVGKWGKNSPAARRALIDYVPFGQWYRAATTYVLVTFPKHHPIQLAVLASLENMTEEERKKLGLTKRGGGVPGFLQGSLPTDKGPVSVSGYSSFGFFNDYLGNLAGGQLPWLPLNELKGISWKGDRIRNKDGSELTEQQRLSLAAYSLMESVIPMVSIGRRLQEGGGTSTDFSTIFKPQVKPGTKGDFWDATNRVFNPIRPMGPPKPKKTGPGYDWSQVNLNPKSTGSYDWSKVVIK